VEIKQFFIDIGNLLQIGFSNQPKLVITSSLVGFFIGLMVGFAVG